MPPWNLPKKVDNNAEGSEIGTMDHHGTFHVPGSLITQESQKFFAQGRSRPQISKQLDLNLNA
ncbi:unnamed protein product [Acidithrix sp. C25]|nr:unnamed protein product [Acidithrix sp. C25]